MCIIGLSVLMELPSRPAVLEGIAAQIVPSVLLLFLGLKHLYASRLINKPDLLARAGPQDEDQNGENRSGKREWRRGRSQAEWGGGGLESGKWVRDNNKMRFSILANVGILHCLNLDSAPSSN